MINNRTIVVMIIVGYLLFGFLSWFPTPDRSDVVRLILSCVLCWFLYKRANWARVALGILSLLAVLVMAVVLFKMPGEVEGIAILATMCAFYGFAAYVLLSQRFKDPISTATDA